MPNYSGLLNNNYGLANGLFEGFKSGLDSFRQGRQDAREEAQQALDNQMKKKMYAYDLAKSGLQESTDASGNTTYTTSPQELEKEKRQDEQKRSLLKFQKDLEAGAARMKEIADFKRTIQTKYADKGQIVDFDKHGNIVGFRPAAGLMQGGTASAGLLTPANGELNEAKVAQAVDMGLIPKNLGPKAMAELGNYQALQNEIKTTDESFENAKNNASVIGRISRTINPHSVGAVGAGLGALGGGFLGSWIPGAGTLAGVAAGAYGGKKVGEGAGEAVKDYLAATDEPTKRYDAAAKPYLDLATKNVTGRVTPVSVENLRPLLPEQGNDPETLALKLREAHNLFKGARDSKFPILRAYGLIPKDDPLLQLETTAGSKPAGTHGGLTPEEQKEFEKLDAKFGKRK